MIFYHFTPFFSFSFFTFSHGIVRNVHEGRGGDGDTTPRPYLIPHPHEFSHMERAQRLCKKNTFQFFLFLFSRQGWGWGRDQGMYFSCPQTLNVNRKKILTPSPILCVFGASPRETLAPWVKWTSLEIIANVTIKFKIINYITKTDNIIQFYQTILQILVYDQP